MRRLEARTWSRLGAILLLALALRLVNLGGRTLWYDEAIAIFRAEPGWEALVDGTLGEDDGEAADVHPLLYYQMLNVWMDLFGQGVATVRLLSVLLGVATVGVVFGLARDWFDERTATVAGLIAAVAPFHVQYSQETRMYALLALLLLLATWVYWRAWMHRHAGYWLAFGVLAGASMHVQQLASMYLLALGLLPLLRRDRVRIIYTGLAAGLALAIYLPWMLNLPDQMGKLRQYWVQKPNVLHMWLALRSFVSVNLDFSAGWWLPTFLLAAVLMVFLLYRASPLLRSGTRRLRGLNEDDREPVRWLVWLAFMPMVFTWIVSQIFQPVFLPRALLPSALVFYIGLAWLFTRAAMPRVVSGGLATAWGVIAVFGLVTHYTWDTFPNAPFDDAVEYLAGEVEAEDVIVHGNKITALPMVFYDRDLPQHYVRDIPGSGSDTLARPTQEAIRLLADECVAVAAGGAPRVWYVAFDRLEDELIDLTEDDPANARYDSLRWLRAHYEESSVRSFNDLHVYLFTGPNADALRASCDAD